MEHSKFLNNSDINEGEESKSVLVEKLGKVEDAILSGKKEMMIEGEEKENEVEKKPPKRKLQQQEYNRNYSVRDFYS